MIGSTLGHYRILRSLGRGGMGEVWAAEDTKLGRQVALKLLLAGEHVDEESLARFKREAKAIAALDHPNIVTIHSIEQADDTHFITMQMVEGRTLTERLAEVGDAGLPLPELFNIAGPLADAIAAAHSRGITHRDLKPANVMITHEGRVLVLDFGLAKTVSVSADDKTQETIEMLTGKGTIVGTVAYMSPEQAEGREVDERTDLFSLGVILYEMCTGRRPFQGDTQMSILTAIIRDEPRPVDEVNADVPRPLARIIRHCLEKHPDRRFQSAKDLRNELDSLRGELLSDPSRRLGSGATAAAAAPARPGIPLRSWLGAGAVGVAVVALAFWGWRAWSASAFRAAQLEQIQQLVEANDLGGVFAWLAANELAADDPQIAAAVAPVAGTIQVELQPADAGITARRADSSRPDAPLSEPLEFLPAATPVIAGEYLLQVRAPGHGAVDLLADVAPGASVAIAATLVPETPETAGMVLVPAGPSPLDRSVVVAAFLIDAREVTNEQFLEFVAAGGYRRDELWPDTLQIGGQPVPRARALQAFTDRTGIPAPRDWSGGRYADGFEAHPVTGVSWYEASAYARWRGKDLPDAHQWWRAAIAEGGRAFPWGNDVRTLFGRANFGLVGTTPAGSLPLGLSPFGCFDMAGNVREWLAAGPPGPYAVAGGAWSDPEYMFDPGVAEAFDPDYARDAIGFRLARPYGSGQ